MKSKGVASESFYYLLIPFVGFAILVALILNQVWEYYAQVTMEHKNALASAKNDAEYVNVSMNKLMTITGDGGMHLDEYVTALNSEGNMQVRIVHSRYIDAQYGFDENEQPETTEELNSFKDGKPRSWETEEFFTNVIPMTVNEWCQTCHFTLEDETKPLPIGFVLGLIDVKIPTTRFKEIKNLLQRHTYRAIVMETLIVLLFGLGIFLSGTGLRKMARQNRLILEKALEGFLMLDLKGIVLNCNHTFAAMLGYLPEELVGTDVRDICGKRDSGEIKMPLSAEEIDNQFREIDVYKTRDGRLLDVETSVTIIESGKDRIIYGFIRDITESKQSREELVRAKENLESKNREMQKDLNIAHEMQLSIVPQKERVKFFSQRFSLGISSVFKPCQKLGGDYWDFVDINEEKIGIIIVDFAGHGIVPCFNAFRIKEFIYTLEDNEIGSPGIFLKMLNRRIFEDFGTHATAYYAVYDRQNKKLTYSRAGHPYALCHRKNENKLMELKAEGMALGFQPGSKYEEKEINLEEGDKVVFYTDGIIEAGNKKGGFFGEERLKDIVLQSKDNSHSEMLDAVINSLKEFTAGAELDDDTTVVTIEPLGV